MAFLTRLIAGAILIIAPATSAMAGEHARRAAAELAVMAGDLRMFENQSLSSLHKDGLVERISGSIAGLAILLRLADQELARPAHPYNLELQQLRQFRKARNLPQMDAMVAKLAATHPLNTAGILALKPTKSGLDTARILHEDLCAGCHDDPDLDTNRPAYNLFKQAQDQTATEFLARMMVGVRGDRITGIDNPLDDVQLSSLYSYYLSGDPEQQ